MLEHSLEVSITGLVEIPLHRCDIAAARVAAHQVLNIKYYHPITLL